MTGQSERNVIDVTKFSTMSTQNHHFLLVNRREGAVHSVSVSVKSHTVNVIFWLLIAFLHLTSIPCDGAAQNPDEEGRKWSSTAQAVWQTLNMLIFCCFLLLLFMVALIDPTKKWFYCAKTVGQKGGLSVLYGREELSQIMPVCVCVCVVTLYQTLLEPL